MVLKELQDTETGFNMLGNCQVLAGWMLPPLDGSCCKTMWGFPKIRGSFLGVPMIRIITFWGL